jgi:hypothetical protein
MSGETAITVTTVVQQGEGLVSADVGGEVVMLHIEKSAYYDADPIGADIWRRLSGPVAVRDLCAALIEQYDVDPATCEVDVLVFLTEAYAEGLIRVVA